MGHLHDIIAIGASSGASSGGVQALEELVSGFPPDLPAAVFVALHTAPGHPSRLPGDAAERDRARRGDHVSPVRLLPQLLSRLAREPAAGPRAPDAEAALGVLEGFSLESLALEQAEEVERALWAAARALEESASILRRAGASAGSDELRRRLAEREAAQLHDARVVRDVLLHGKLLSAPDVPGVGSAAAASR